MKDGTVKQFLDALDEMRTIYPFEDDKTTMHTLDPYTHQHGLLRIFTRDERTGIHIEMLKDVVGETEGR